MPIQRTFLDWQAPALPAAADLLLAEPAEEGILDLSGIVVALPGARAGRRLLEILVERAEQKSLMLVPPDIITSGRLPELLYTAHKPFANDFTQRLAWIEALQATDRDQLAHVIREPPARDDLFAWLSLGAMLSQLHRELAADNLDFQDVARQAGQIPGFHEAERWQTLAAIQQAYLRRLDEFELWDLQTARLFAIEHRECRTDKRIYLVGTVDLNQAQRAMLDQVADRVTAVVFAPPELADRFDEHGCVRPETWLEMPIELDAERIEVVDTAADQADAVVRAVAGFDAAFAADEITVGVPDERLVAPIQQRLDECGVPSRYGVGVPAARIGPCLLLSAVADYLESRRPRDFAALVRHPAIAHWARGQKVNGDWLTQLDQYRATHLPTRLDGKWLGAAKDYEALHKIHEKLEGKGKKKAQGLLRELSEKKRPLGEWGDAVIDLIVEVYGASPLDREADRHVVAACDAIHAALDEQREIPAKLAPAVTGAEALRLLLQALSGQTIPPRADHSAIELLGWLELALDDAPALVVSGFNDGLVPASRNSDLFLPNELRRQLGLEDNNRIYARDAYALSAIAASRQSLAIVAGRRSADNDPLAPSRLLFACPPEELARRTLRFLRGDEQRRPRITLPGSLAAGQERSLFAAPDIPQPLSEVTSMRVTEFRDYLACPYRYYLRHQLHLAAVDDGGDELDGGEFGSLLHEVLRAFGDGDFRSSDVAEEISEILNRLLDEEVSRQYGKQPLSAVNVQVEQIRSRLRVFADWQAEWARGGWDIILTEASIADGDAPFAVDDVPMYLRGRIDRIDRNRVSGEVVVFDYKTGESANPPDKTHRRRDEWVDLQLPLYRHLVRCIDDLSDVDRIQMGYIVIPKSTAHIGHHLAEWTAEDLAHADDTARGVIRDIRSGRFYPPRTPAPAFFEEFSAICLDGQYHTPNGETEESE